MAFMAKHRDDGTVRTSALAGNADGMIAIIVDDLISTGTTIRNAAVACREAGAKKIYALATHGVFTAEAGRMLANAGLEKIIVTDSIAQVRTGMERIESKLVVLPTAALFAEAIWRMHCGESLVELLET